MTRYKYNGKATGQKSATDYNRRSNLVRSGRAMWLRDWSIGAEAAAEKAGLP